MALVNVELRSAHFPTVTWAMDDALAPSGKPGIGAALMAWLRPAVKVETPLGTMRKAPWGEPAGSTWPAVPVVLAFLVLVVLWLAWRGVRSLRRS